MVSRATNTYRKMTADVTSDAMLPTDSCRKLSAYSPPFCPSVAIASRTESWVSVTSRNGMRASTSLAESSSR